MRVNSEQRRLMAEYDNRERRPRGAQSRAKGENNALAELSRFVDAQKGRREESRELRGRPSAEIRRETSYPAEPAGSHARKRGGGAPDPIDAASARTNDSRNGEAWAEPQEEGLDLRPVDIGDQPPARGRSLYSVALIFVIGVVGLTASVVTWRVLSNPAETELIGRGTREPKPQPERMVDADHPAENGSIAEAPSADISPQERGSAPAPVGIPTSPPSIPSPETTPTRAPAGAKLGDPGYVLAPIEEAATKPKLLFDQAPPLNLDSSSEPSPEPSKVGKVDKAGDAENPGDVESVNRVEKDSNSRANESTSNCLVKVDGRILINRSCHVSWTQQRRVAFELAEKPLTISYDHGRVWLATLGGQELGKVYKTGSCWGSKRVYVCEHHK